MQPAASRERSHAAPEGRFGRGRGWVFACVHPGLYATFLSGRCDEPDLDALTRVYGVPAAAARPHAARMTTITRLGLFALAASCAREPSAAVVRSATEVGLVANAQDITGRDGGGSGVAWGRSVWVFGDTVMTAEDGGRDRDQLAQQLRVLDRRSRRGGRHRRLLGGARPRGRARLLRARDGRRGGLQPRTPR